MTLEWWLWEDDSEMMTMKWWLWNVDSALKRWLWKQDYNIKKGLWIVDSEMLTQWNYDWKNDSVAVMMTLNTWQ